MAVFRKTAECYQYDYYYFFFLLLQVEVLAEADPERVMADTEAWRNRLVNENEFQRPLYSINTYTDTQVNVTKPCSPLTLACLKNWSFAFICLSLLFICLVYSVFSFLFFLVKFSLLGFCFISGEADPCNSGKYTTKGFWSDSICPQLAHRQNPKATEASQ